MIKEQSLNIRVNMGICDYGCDNMMTKELVDFGRNLLCCEKKVEPFEE